MKKLLLSFIMFVFASYSVYSQNQDTIKYKILEDDPSKVSNLHLFLVPAYAEYFKANPSTGWGFGCNVIINRIYGDFSLFNSLDLIGISNYEHEKLWNIGGGYVLGDNTYTTETKIKAAESSHKTNFWTGTERWTEWYVYPRLTHRDIYIARGGMFIYNFHEESYVRTYSNGQYYTQYVKSKKTYPSIYGGICMQMIDNSVIQIENGYEVKNKDIWNLYADILFAPMKKTIEDDNGNVTEERNLLGFRIGYEYKKIKKVNAFCIKLELGIRPGIKKEGFFVALYIYLPIVNINTLNTNKANNSKNNSNF